MLLVIFQCWSPLRTCRTGTVFHPLPSSHELRPCVFEVGILEVPRLCDDFRLRVSVTLALRNDVEEQRPNSLTCHSTPPNMATPSTSRAHISLLKGWDVIPALRTWRSAILVGEDTWCCCKVDSAVRWILGQA